MPPLWPSIQGLPVLIGDDTGRPWATGEVWHRGNAAPETHGHERLMAAWWEALAEPDPDEDEVVTTPFERRWPGLAPSSPGHAPEVATCALANRLRTTARGWGGSLQSAGRTHWWPRGGAEEIIGADRWGFWWD